MKVTQHDAMRETRAIRLDHHDTRGRQNHIPPDTQAGRNPKDDLQDGPAMVLKLFVTGSTMMIDDDEDEGKMQR